MRTNHDTSADQHLYFASGTDRACLWPLVSMLAACGKVDRLATASSTVPFDYQKRHPIVLTNKPFVTKIFPATTGFREPTMNVLQTLRAPLFQGWSRPDHCGISLHEVHAGRGSLNRHPQRACSQWCARQPAGFNSYPVIDRRMAAPIRVSFVGLAAKVATRCGEWPDDLASASSLDGWNNKPYWNLGCSYQTMLAAQTSDPRDLATPRGETRTGCRNANPRHRQCAQRRRSGHEMAGQEHHNQQRWGQLMPDEF